MALANNIPLPGRGYVYTSMYICARLREKKYIYSAPEKNMAPSAKNQLFMTEKTV
jgi:hypothetical protein